MVEFISSRFSNSLVVSLAFISMMRLVLYLCHMLFFLLIIEIKSILLESPHCFLLVESILILNYFESMTSTCIGNSLLSICGQLVCFLMLLDFLE
jgi:hypothetical protein